MSLRSFAVIPPPPLTYRVRLEPVLSVVNILLMIGHVEQNYGLPRWVMETTNQMTVDERKKHTLLIHLASGEGFADVIAHYPEEYSDFPAFVDMLESLNPIRLRDILLYRMFNSLHLRVLMDKEDDGMLVDVNGILTDEVRFHSSMKHMIKSDYDPEHATRLFHLFNEPETLQSQLVEHLRMMWERFIAGEWARMQPVISEFVNQYAQIETDGLPVLEAIQAVTGRDLRVVFDVTELEKLNEIVFIPSRHNGPYVSWFGTDETLYLFFTARGAASEKPLTREVDPSVLLDRLAALSDETRLGILFALKQYDELTTQELMQRFDLNKSAVSRHLRQLFATGFIFERRDQDNKTKIYSLSKQGIQQVLNTLQSTFLND